MQYQWVILPGYVINMPWFYTSTISCSYWLQSISTYNPKSTHQPYGYLKNMQLKESWEMLRVLWITVYCSGLLCSLCRKYLHVLALKSLPTTSIHWWFHRKAGKVGLAMQEKKSTKARTQTWAVIKDCIKANVSAMCSRFFYFYFLPQDKRKIIKTQLI